MDSHDKRHQLCTWPGCGKNVKDLISHLLTHQCQRPFKCPVRWCEYATKGFARKYDKTRHALAHWKAVTRCKFCPESLLGLDVNFFGLSELKSHLKNIHAAEATDTSSPGDPGSCGHSGSITCSACHQVFLSVQTFYCHLDDCVLEALERDNPIDDINTRNLAPIENDQDVLETLARHGLSSIPGADPPSDTTWGTSSSPTDHDLEPASGPGYLAREPDEEGRMTSQGIGAKGDKTRRRNRTHYPPSWGFNMDEMKVRRRRLAMVDGPERLHMEDMVVSMEDEVHVELSEGNSYVTDLDLQTLSRITEIEAMREVGAAGSLGDNGYALGQFEPGEPAWLNGVAYDWATMQEVPFT